MRGGGRPRFAARWTAPARSSTCVRLSVSAAHCCCCCCPRCAAKEAWDLVIVDPPSFAPNRAAVPKARASYERLFEAAARVTVAGGILALASCSSHIAADAFHEICEAALGRARRTAAVLGVHGQPADHPFPLACAELRYLKLNVYALD